MKKTGARFSQRLFGSRSFPITGIPLPPVAMTEQVKWVVAKQKHHLQPPCNIKGEPHPLFQFVASEEHPDYVYPEEGILKISNGIATASGANLTSTGTLVSTFLQHLDGKPAEEHPIYYFSIKRFFPRILHVNHPIIALTDSWQGAFYHWMYQVLPKLGLIDRPYPKIYADQSHPFQKQSMELLGLKDLMISASQYDAIQASQVIAASSTLCPTCHSTQFLREAFLSKVPTYPKKRIYLSRRDARTRRLINEVEILPILDQFGFERVEFAALSFQEQIALFRSAQMVVAPHGAGLSHLVFCDPGTPVLEMFHSKYINNCYWQLCSLQNLPYYMLFDDQPSAEPDPDIYIDPKRVKSTLEEMERDRRYR